MSYHFEKITLQISDADQQELKDIYSKIKKHISDTESFHWRNLIPLQEKLSQVIAEQAAITDILNKMKAPGAHFCHLNIHHPDAEILSLPWEIACNGDDGTMLSEVERLFLSKRLLAPDIDLEKPAIAPGPLKILVMISAPDDLPPQQRLNYEEEQFLLLKSFAPLIQKGEVVVDFTDDGSLDALKRKIEINNYHILHFTAESLFGFVTACTTRSGALR